MPIDRPVDEAFLKELVQALKDNWVGHEVLQARAVNKAPKYGRDDDEADEMARKVMEYWSEVTWKHATRSTKRQFRPGMLSWNYWIAYSDILPASPDGLNSILMSGGNMSNPQPHIFSINPASIPEKSGQ